MDREAALQFLREHQPMPPEDQVDDDLIDRYDEVRKYFIANPDPARFERS